MFTLSFADLATAVMICALVSTVVVALCKGSQALFTDPSYAVLILTGSISGPLCWGALQKLLK
jgi:hypothetical protein